MGQEAVLYFDILGFRQKSRGRAEEAVDALTDLATLLGTPAIAQMARSLPPRLVDWLLRPTSAPGVWEVLWPLPTDPKDVVNDAICIKDLSDRALTLLRTHGGHPSHGAHYRELLLLAARCAARITRLCREEAIKLPPVSPFLTRADVLASCEATSGIPDEYVTALMRLVESTDAVPTPGNG